VVGWEHASSFVSSFVVRECWGDEDAPVIHMGIIVGMRGVSIRMQPLKRDDCRGSDDEEEAPKQRVYDLCVGEYDIEVGGKSRLCEIRELAHIPHLNRCNRAMPVWGSALYVSD